MQRIGRYFLEIILMELIKLFVATGIYWLEIPAAGLRILCGCPMDSVKHLMKRGLIMPTEKSGVPCETGPNAILLSDVMLQNGEFANLGEFPVLQMLYKQGMILPGHPNNTGQKPLLIGQAEQVNAQMQYIFRGNYGLISREEIAACGVDEACTDAIMRMKLRFAFGAIRPSRTLLDGCVVGDQEVEIRNGAYVVRKGRNRYEFRYKEERVQVDLNLEANQRYESAYPLGFQHLPRDYFSIIHSGEGDGWDVNRPSMSSILMFHGKIYLIDAGPNLYYNLSALGIGIDEVEGLFHTHAHDDHFAGITSLMRSGRKIRYYATRLVRATVEKKWAALLSIEEERFAEFFDIHDLNPEVWNDIEGLEVRPILSPHPVETTIFLFRTLWQEGYRSYAHFADIVSLELLEKMVVSEPGQPGVDRACFERVRSEYLTPVDLKKLDIGGGMIHGFAKDFVADRSQRILLSHLARELNPAEKEIGSSAPHGMQDVLIAGESDFVRRRAFALLQSAFPTIPLHHLRMLINCPLVDFPPGRILLKAGDVPEQIYLILTGAVEKIRTSDGIFGRVSSGAMIGEMAGLLGSVSRYTFSTVCFVKALEIPVRLYRELVQRNGFMERILRHSEIGAFLQSTPLFSEGMSPPVMAQLLEELTHRTIPAGEIVVCRDLSRLNIIQSGRIERSIAGVKVDQLQAGDHFGEERAVFNTPCLFRLTALEDVELLQLSGEQVQEIPIVRWKLFESYHNRAILVVHGGDAEAGSLRWNSSFNIQILEMDTHHKRLVEIANAILEILHSGEDRGSLENAFESLVDYTEYHFEAEERLMARYGYPELPRHQEKHRQLVRQVLEFRANVQQITTLRQVDFNGFFVQWLIRHIHNEDRQYSTYLNDKGVY
ncbi:MAG: bacteriohemerythrin [Magnetococcales bacterium]|nr:bacteriohemerythrin [Magnetococcales bacterium]